MGGGRAYCRAAASLRNHVEPRPTLAVTKIYVACVGHPFPGGNTYYSYSFLSILISMQNICVG